MYKDKQQEEGCRILDLRELHEALHQDNDFESEYFDDDDADCCFD